MKILNKISNQNKKIIFDNFINIIEFIKKYTNMSSKSIGQYIRALHIAYPLINLIIFINCSKFILFFFLISIIIYHISFYKFNGCIFSKFEILLLNDNFTVVDIFLEIFRMEITKENRYKATYIMWCIFDLIIFFILYIRFK